MEITGWFADSPFSLNATYDGVYTCFSMIIVVIQLYYLTMTCLKRSTGSSVASESYMDHFLLGIKKNM
jgi:hypothetical protein